MYLIKCSICFYKNYWETIKIMLKIPSFTIIKIISLLVVSILGVVTLNYNNIICFSTIQQILLSILIVILAPFFFMPFTLTAKIMKLEEMLEQRKKKDALCLELKAKLDQVDQYTIDYVSFLEETVKLIDSFGILSEADIFDFKYFHNHYFQKNTIRQKLIEIIRKLKY